jgi:hypothetical protein
MRGKCRIAKTSVESHSIGTIPLLSLHASRLVLPSGIGKPSGHVEQNALLQAAPGRLSMQDNVAMPLIVTAPRLAIRPTSKGPAAHQGIKGSDGHGRASRQCGMSTSANSQHIGSYVIAPANNRPNDLNHAGVHFELIPGIAELIDTAATAPFCAVLWGARRRGARHLIDVMLTVFR